MHILCNSGGEFVFKYNKIHYQGGETGLLVVDECISYLDLLSRVKRILAIESGDGFEIKYRYPGSEVDDPLVLVTLRNDDDIHNMISSHTSQASIAVTSSPPSPPVRLYLFQTSDQNQSTATNGTLLPFRKDENASIVEETLKEKQTGSSDKFNLKKRRPKLTDMEWITSIAQVRIENNLPCEEKDIMDEIRNEYGFDVDYSIANRCRNRAIRELGLLRDEKKKDGEKAEYPKSSMEWYGSNMMNGPFPPPPPRFPDLHISELQRNVSGIQAFLVEFRRHAMILQVILLLLLLHYEMSKK